MSKTVLITGATSGLGTLAAYALLNQGHDLVLLGRTEKRLKTLESAVKTGCKNNVTFVVGDVTNYQVLAGALRSIHAVDVVINAAAIAGPVSPLDSDQAVSEWNRCISVNLYGTCNVNRLMLSRLRNSPHGKIINFAGGEIEAVRPNHTAYAASKAAVVHLTETLAYENPSLDINAIAPGEHYSGIWTQENQEHPVEWGDPLRYQAFISFMCSDSSNGITGRFIHCLDPWDKPDFKSLAPEMYKLRRAPVGPFPKTSTNAKKPK